MEFPEIEASGTGHPCPPPHLDLRLDRLTRPAAGKNAAEALLSRAAAPVAVNPAFRTRLIDLKKSFEQAIDDISKDEVLVAGYSEEAKERAKTIVASFEKYIEEHKDEITAIQVLYSRPWESASGVRRATPAVA